MIVALAALGAGSAFGAGFQLYTEGSAEAVGQGAAISARRDMVSNAWYNPASITDFKEARLMLGGTMVQINSKYNDKTNAAFDGELKDHWNAIPHMFYIQPLPEKTKTSFFLSVTSPFGLMTDWDWGYDPLNPGPVYSRKMAFESVYAIPGLSYKVTDKLSIAAGVGPVYAKVRYTSNLMRNNGTNVELNGDDMSYAYILGLNYQLAETWNVALKYQSPVNLTLTGDATYNQAWALAKSNQIKGDVTLPQNIVLGVSTTAVPRWTLSFDVVYTDWSEYDRFDVLFFDNPGAFGTAPGHVSSTKNWRDVFSYRLGGEYKINDQWKWRCGYVYDDSPARDEYRGPELPDSDRHMFATGVGYDRQSWGIDAAYCFLYMKQSDSNLQSATKGNLVGRYEDGYAHLVSGSVWYKF